MHKIARITTFLLLGCLITFANGAEPKKKPTIDVVFVLDTTGSMGGLIQAAKTKIWSIANTMASAKPTPTIRMGLVAYRDRGDSYVTQVTDLSDDLDAVYAALIKFQANGGGDGPESVNLALAHAVSKISWKQDKHTYKVIFLVGDAPPHMDYKEQQYPAICKAAVKQDIIINTIQCGNNGGAVKPWREIARRGEGDYVQLSQSGNAVVVNTPFDKRLGELNAEMAATYIHRSTTAGRRSAAKMKAAEKVMGYAPKPAAAARAEYAARKADAAKDIVACIKAEPDVLDEIKEAELPAKLRKMTPKERQAYVKKMADKRAAVQKEILELSKKRQAYIKKELGKTKKGKTSLDEVIFKSIAKQSRRKGLKFEGGPSL